MPTWRYPLLLVRDAASGFSAIAIDEQDVVGFGVTSGAARDDARAYFQYRATTHPWLMEPDFHDPELHVFKLVVRPEYRTPQRIYPCLDIVTLHVHCVTGKQKSGQLLAALPLLGLRFTYHDAQGLKALVQRYAGQKLEGLPPETVARFLAPAHVELDSVVIRVPNEQTFQETATPPAQLSRIAEPLGEKAVRKQFSRAWEREKEVAVLVRKLHKEKANVLLVGEPGVGKTTTLVDAVREVERQLTEEAKRNGEKPHPRRFWQTSSGRIIAGMKYLGQWEERVEAIISELGEIQGVLCVERLLDLVGTGGTSPSDSIAAFLLPYLARGELRMVAEASPAELDACRRLLPGLADVFQIMPLAPFERVQALAVLDRQIQAAKTDWKLEVAQGVSDRIVQLFRRFMPYSVFPGQAGRFTRELLEKAQRGDVGRILGSVAAIHGRARDQCCRARGDHARRLAATHSGFLLGPIHVRSLPARHRQRTSRN